MGAWAHRLPGQLAPGLAIALAILLADQGSKLWAATALELYRPRELLPILNLTLSHNTGAAFSLLADQSGWQRWVLSAFAAAVSGYLVWWLARLNQRAPWHVAGLASVLGGALGNLVDRLLHGYVIDFVDFHYGDWHYPAFNIADSAISVGFVLLVVAIFSERGVTDADA